MNTESNNSKPDQDIFNAESIPKMLGADIEVGNFVKGMECHEGTGHHASRALLREIDGLPKPAGLRTSRSPRGQYESAVKSAKAHNINNDSKDQRNAGNHNHFGYDYSTGYGIGYKYNPRDWGRKFLQQNGGCIYIDLDHLEFCIPEVRSAFEFVGYFHGMLRIVRKAQVKANSRLKDGKKIVVLINNSDGKSNSYGSHLNLMVKRKTFDYILGRKPHYLLYLASYFASSIIFTGAGKVGSENGLRPVDFQISQRADFFEKLLALQTTYNRPIVNSRDESLCGSRWNGRGSGVSDKIARLHIIFFDNTLCHVSTLLKAGVTQIILAMMEREWVIPELMLDDPVLAVKLWSRDPSLETKSQMITGKSFTAAEVQVEFYSLAKRFVESGKADGVVPHAREIMKIWHDTLELLYNRDIEKLIPRLDWVLKYFTIKRAIEQKGLSWGSPEVKVLDHQYSSLDPNEGLYWNYDRSGVVERLIDEDQIKHCADNAPEDTRAWTRAKILQKVDPVSIEDVDWDEIKFRVKTHDRSYWHPYKSYTFNMDNPLGFKREDSEPILNDSGSVFRALITMGMSPTCNYSESTNYFGNSTYYSGEENEYPSPDGDGDKEGGTGNEVHGKKSRGKLTWLGRTFGKWKPGIISPGGNGFSHGGRSGNRHGTVGRQRGISQS